MGLEQAGGVVIELDKLLHAKELGQWLSAKRKRLKSAKHRARLAKLAEIARTAYFNQNGIDV